jgi:hypothetical protein
MQIGRRVGTTRAAGCASPPTFLSMFSGETPAGGMRSSNFPTLLTCQNFVYEEEIINVMV